jgi:hypothetical protein
MIKRGNPGFMSRTAENPGSSFAVSASFVIKSSGNMGMVLGD